MYSFYPLRTIQVRHQQLQEEVEKRRVLEDALHVLAREHLALEQSVRVRAHVSRAFPYRVLGLKDLWESLLIIRHAATSFS